MPKHWRMLSHTGHVLVLRRGARTVELRVPEDQSLVSLGPGNLFRADEAPLRVGQSIVVPGDPTEELLYQSKIQQADLIVLGAQGASAFAAITRHGVVYKLLAQSHCPVMTLSPAVLTAHGAQGDSAQQADSFLAGIF